MHGHPGSADDWPHLVSVAAKYGRAVAIDLPGFGEAGDGPGFPYTVAAEAKWLGQALAALRIDRVHLALHDFGGPIALEWAKGDPDKLRLGPAAATPGSSRTTTGTRSRTCGICRPARR